MGFQSGPMYISMGVLVFHIPLCYLLVIVLELGVTGTGLSTTISMSLSLAAHYLYTSYVIKDSDRKEAWFLPWSGQHWRQCFDT